MKSIYYYIVIICAIFSIFFIPSSGIAAELKNYTAYPPFLPSGATPNLLLMIDNSASMYDMSYIDEGSPTREPNYCYDETYAGSTQYEGYFERGKEYKYDPVTDRFIEEPLPTMGCTHEIPGELCVDILTGPPGTVDGFYARGNYLNWLAASKFDVQKKILTGGKYDTLLEEIQSETRGCQGKRFLKQPLAADYVEGGVNTALPIIFAISGELNPNNSLAPSLGGQAYIEIFEGEYNEAFCQDAIDAINDVTNPHAIRTALEDCLSYDGFSGKRGDHYCLEKPTLTCLSDSDCDTVVPGDCKSDKCVAPASMVGERCRRDSDCNTVVSVGPCVIDDLKYALMMTKVVFNHTIHECWHIWRERRTEVGNSVWTSERPKCEDIYRAYRVCKGGTNDDTVCTDDTDCTGGGLCIGGPDAILPSNPAAILCSRQYAGYCATSSDDWLTTDWLAMEYATNEECFSAKYTELCYDMPPQPVVDPTNETGTTDGLPAIISDIGVEAQLGAPVIKMKANISTTAPSGLIDDYKDSIRFGVMKFNEYGSISECAVSATDELSCMCSASETLCDKNEDCPSGETCGLSTNMDASSIMLNSYIGQGFCSISSGTECVRDDQCPAGETCNATIGDHTSGLIHDIDEIKANTWTPLAESYYNAIAYYVKDAELNVNLDVTKYTAAANAIQEPLDTTFTSGYNPIELSCQKNNILIISDGGSTADINSTMTGAVASIPISDGDAIDSSSCGGYFGSTYLDDLSYFSRNKNIFNPSDINPDDDDAAQSITTYVVYSGPDLSTGDECEPKTLMENTAANGGTTLYTPENPTDLAKALRSVFNTIKSGAASGSSVGLLSTKGNGSGAIYQAYFNPEPVRDRKWFGYLHSLFIDEYGNIREDTDANNTLDLTIDYIIEMKYDLVDPANPDSDKKTLVYKYADSDGDGIKDILMATVTLDEVNSLWRAGPQLAKMPPVDRNIITTATDDGSTWLYFNDTNAVTLTERLKAADEAEAIEIINWTRGETISGYRERDITIDAASYNWKLGDIIYSTPTAVGPPKENFDFRYGDETYHEFETAKSKRLEVVYVGANDGMLHAFNAGCYDEDTRKYYPDVDPLTKECIDSVDQPLGKELWAYIPRGMLPHLKWYTMPDYTHVYGVDLKPKVTDVKIFGTAGDEWGTILIGGYRYGGKNISWTEGAVTKTAQPEYFALDITNPPGKEVLWTFTDVDLGLTMSYPSVAKVGDKWYAIFGSGPTDYDSDSNITANKPGNVFILDLSSSDASGVISTWILNVNYWKIPTGNPTSFMSDPIAVDRDIIDSAADVIYIGENYHNGTSWTSRMLRIPIDNTVPPWTPSTVLNVADVPGSGNDMSQQITAPPAVSSDDRGNVWLFFGTGRFLGYEDKNHTDTGAMYAVKDGCWNGDAECTSTPYTGLIDISGASVIVDLLDKTVSVSGISSTCAPDVISDWNSLTNAVNLCDGWVMYYANRGESVDFTGNTLQRDGERMISRPVVFGGIVAWTTYVPGIGACKGLGESNAYVVYYKSGTAYKYDLFSQQSELIYTSERAINLGEGISSPPSVVLTYDENTDGVKAKLIIGTSTGTIETIESELPLHFKSGSAAWTINHIP